MPVVDAEGRLLVPHEIIEATGFDVAAFVMSQNLHRRHLTPKQRRELTGELLKADPSRSDRATARLVGVSPTTVGTIRQNLEKAGQVSKLDSRTDAQGRQQPATRPTRQRQKPEPREEPSIPAPPVIEAPEPPTVEVRRVEELSPAPPESRRLTTDDILAKPEMVGAAIAYCLIRKLGPKAAQVHAARLIAALEGTVKREASPDAEAVRQGVREAIENVGRKRSPAELAALMSRATVRAPNAGDGMEEALAEAGSISELARLLHLSRSTVKKWNKIPEERLDAVALALGLPREKLRPDLYPPETV